MPNRKITFANNEYYHIYNRGVDKRKLFTDKKDFERFLQSIVEFNNKENIGSIYENSLKKEKVDPNPLIEFLAFCINPNHFHFIIKQLEDGGISKYMQKLSSGYTNYFNEKHKRTGSLFGGKFKAKHVDSYKYLLHLSAYVNLNLRVHQFGSPTPKLEFTKSSWEQYVDNKPKKETGKNKDRYFIPCNKDIFSDTFRSIEKYKRFAEEEIEEIIKMRIEKDRTEKEQDELI
ncbi:MAG: Transposase [Parcubacteria group bacterium GW2011_GWF2_38_76]|nr:MAG: Transposase [Parcubacteria group bacterium GW2011_GWF2_38_76]HBM45361.1 hypothetical protein [Patescibacteria group bacterium]